MPIGQPEMAGWPDCETRSTAQRFVVLCACFAGLAAICLTVFAAFGFDCAVLGFAGADVAAMAGIARRASDATPAVTNVRTDFMIHTPCWTRFGVGAMVPVSSGVCAKNAQLCADPTDNQVLRRAK